MHSRADYTGDGLTDIMRTAAATSAAAARLRVTAGKDINLICDVYLHTYPGLLLPLAFLAGLCFAK